MELAFDIPIPAFDGFEFLSAGFFGRKACEQEHRLRALLVLAQDYSCDGGDLTG